MAWAWKVLSVALVVALTGVVMGAGGAAIAGDPPASMRVLRTTAVVDATPEQVWEAFTTKAGVESWMVPLAEVDFRKGGTLKTNYNKTAGIGGAGTIVHHILAYDPYRMIAMQFTAPESAGDKKLADACWWMVHLEDAGAGKTRVTESMAGWGEGAEWDKVYSFFEKGNEWEMQQLVKKFAKGPVGAGAGVMPLVGRLVGGEWICENTREGGGVFRARQVLERGPDGVSLVGKGWLGDKDGMFYHGTVQVWRDPAGGVRFQNIDQNGAVSAGEITREGENGIVWDWRASGLDGKKSAYRVTMAFESQDRYRFVIREAAAGATDKPMVELTYTRVSAVPEGFLKMKAAGAGK